MECGAEKFETFDVVVDDTEEVSNSTVGNSSSHTPNPMLTAVQQPVDNASTSVTTTKSLSRDLSGNVEIDGKSVHGIVTSLIRTAEETRSHATNAPNFLDFDNKKLQQKEASIEQQVFLYHHSHF